VASRRRTNSEASEISRAPARTPQERENQLIGLAVDLTEKQLMEGTASAQVISHYLKLGSSRERLEQERLKNEVSLLETKRLQLESEIRTAELIDNALKAMQAYTGNAPEIQQPEYDEYE
jgi:hypothetical protein